MIDRADTLQLRGKQERPSESAADAQRHRQRCLLFCCWFHDFTHPQVFITTDFFLPLLEHAADHGTPEDALQLVMSMKDKVILASLRRLRSITAERAADRAGVQIPAQGVCTSR